MNFIRNTSLFQEEFDSKPTQGKVLQKILKIEVQPSLVSTKRVPFWNIKVDFVFTQKVKP